MTPRLRLRRRPARGLGRRRRPARPHDRALALPVVDDGLDDVVGVVHIKRAVAVPLERRAEVPAAALMSEPLWCPRPCGSTRCSASCASGPASWPSSWTSTAAPRRRHARGRRRGDRRRRRRRARPRPRRRAPARATAPGRCPACCAPTRSPTRRRARAGRRRLRNGGRLVMAALGRVPDVGDGSPVEGWRLRLSGWTAGGWTAVRVMPAPEARVRPTPADPVSLMSAGDGAARRSGAAARATRSSSARSSPSAARRSQIEPLAGRAAGAGRAAPCGPWSASR